MVAVADRYSPKMLIGTVRLTLDESTVFPKGVVVVDRPFRHAMMSEKCYFRSLVPVTSYR
jgi:hypothetical protein